MAGKLEFVNPPIVELVLGAQFSPLTKLTAGHFGLFWKELGDKWTDPADASLLDDLFERFDRPRWRTPADFKARLQQERRPGRFQLAHRDQDRLVQMQATRFHLNWRNRGRVYPSYGKLITEFEQIFAQFSTFVESVGIGKLALNQWELTYIDAFPREEYWQTPADWSTFLPGLFGPLFSSDGLGIALENHAAEWSYEIVPRRGRLHILVNPGRVGKDGCDALLLNMTARGPIGSGAAETLRAGLDCGHEAALGTFMRVTSEETKKRWESRK